MTDSAERKVRQWALKRNGAPLENRDVVELVFAFDDDNEARHEEVVGQIQVVAAEGAVRGERIEALERWRRQQEASCESHIRGIVETEHAERHGAHMAECHPPRREDDPHGSDFRDERSAASLTVVDSETKWRVGLIWGIAIFVGATVGAALLQDVIHALTGLITGG